MEREDTLPFAQFKTKGGKTALCFTTPYRNRSYVTAASAAIDTDNAASQPNAT